MVNPVALGHRNAFVKGSYGKAPPLLNGESPDSVTHIYI